MADRIYWIEENGAEQLLNDGENFIISDGIIGRFMPLINLVEEEVPFQPGTRKRNIRIKPRDVDIPLVIKADSETLLRKFLREILRKINPLKIGKLKSVASDGSMRELNCQYIGGLEGTEDEEANGFYIQNTLLTFHAFDPFWYDTNTIVEAFKTGIPATFFPFFPLRLSSSTVFADTTIDNTGDVETWPEWIITGPGENIILKNLNTGEITHLDHMDAKLGIGESITLDTKPFHKTVTKNDGTNLFYTLSDDSSLWALQEGQNSIRLEMSNATEDSSIQLSYKNRYWGP